MTVAITPNYNVGAAVALSVGGTMMYVKGGKVDRSAAKIVVTNARSAGYQQLKAGNKMADLSFDLVYNGDSPPVGIVEGVEATVIFDSVGYETTEGLEDGAGGTPTTPSGRLISGQFLILTVSDAWQVDADYGMSVTASSTGAYTVVDTATGASDIT
jgi:hypothetical protein